MRNALLALLVALPVSAQTVISPVRLQTSLPVVTPVLPGMSVSPLMSSSLLLPSLPSFSAVSVPVLPVVAKPLSVSAVSIRPAVAVSARAVLSASAVEIAASPVRAETSLSSLYDGAAARSAASEPVVVETKTETLAPLKRARRGVFKRAASVTALILATPVTALAAEGPGIFEQALTQVAAYQPFAVAGATLIGVIFGLWMARGKDGAAPSSGEVMASVLRYGVIASAGVFVLLDLVPALFFGMAANPLSPLTAAVATAALGQTAFAAKFTEASTTPADRVMGAFPAVAAAFGFSIGVAALAAAAPLFVGATTMLTVGTAAMAMSGAAIALYTAIFRPASSVPEGPARMGRGFVLQALMSGMALAVASPAYSSFFFALGMAGFALVLYTAGRESVSGLRALLQRLKKR